MAYNLPYCVDFRLECWNWQKLRQLGEEAASQRDRHQTLGLCTERRANEHWHFSKQSSNFSFTSGLNRNQKTLGKEQQVQTQATIEMIN